MRVTGFAVVAAMEDGSVRVIEAAAFTEAQRTGIAHMAERAGQVSGPPGGAPAPAAPAPAAQPATPSDATRDGALRRAKYDAARTQGFTGDPCTQCHAMTVKRNGACLVCDSCGTTTGCS